MSRATPDIRQYQIIIRFFYKEYTFRNQFHEISSPCSAVQLWRIEAALNYVAQIYRSSNGDQCASISVLGSYITYPNIQNAVSRSPSNQVPRHLQFRCVFTHLTIIHKSGKAGQGNWKLFSGRTVHTSRTAVAKNKAKFVLYSIMKRVSAKWGRNFSLPIRPFWLFVYVCQTTCLALIKFGMIDKLSGEPTKLQYPPQNYSCKSNRTS